MMSEVAPKIQNLCERLWNRLLKQEGTDFLFQFKDESDHVIDEFSVHTLILITQSKVFCAMLTGQLKETSPVTLKDTKPSAFRKFIGMLYEQETNIYSIEEAQKLYYLGNKYDFQPAVTLARKYLLSHVESCSMDAIYESGHLFEDKVMLDIVWKEMKTSVINTINSLPCFGRIFAEETNIEVILPPSMDTVQKVLDKCHLSVKDESDLKKKLGTAIGLIQLYLEQAQLLFRKIVPSSDYELVGQVQWRKLNELNLKLAEHIECPKSGCDALMFACQRHAFDQIYRKYTTKNLLRFHEDDLKFIYNEIFIDASNSNVDSSMEDEEEE